MNIHFKFDKIQNVFYFKKKQICIWLSYKYFNFVPFRISKTNRKNITKMRLKTRITSVISLFSNLDMANHFGVFELIQLIKLETRVYTPEVKYEKQALGPNETIPIWTWPDKMGPPLSP